MNEVQRFSNVPPARFALRSVSTCTDCYSGVSRKPFKHRDFLVLPERIELSTSPLPRESLSELSHCDRYARPPARSPVQRFSNIAALGVALLLSACAHHYGPGNSNDAAEWRKINRYLERKATP